MDLETKEQFAKKVKKAILLKKKWKTEMSELSDIKKEISAYDDIIVKVDNSFYSVKDYDIRLLEFTEI